MTLEYWTGKEKVIILPPGSNATIDGITHRLKLESWPVGGKVSRYDRINNTWEEDQILLPSIDEPSNLSGLNEKRKLFYGKRSYCLGNKIITVRPLTAV
jgi:hypothetical protein